MRKSRLLVAGFAAVGLVLAVSVPASAAEPPPTPEVRSTQVVAPFNLSLWGTKVAVADGFANLVGTLAKDGSIVPVAVDQPGASGVAHSLDGRTIAFTTTASTPQEAGPPLNTASGLNIWGPRGEKIYADTLAFETANNPDGSVHYGVADPSPCVAEAFAAVGFPTSYTGGVDSHSYSVAWFGSKWIVADAGSNTLWSVDAKGAIRTLAVLPPQPLTITAEMAASLGFSECVAGVTYAFEPVPTDVEVGLDGSLYVTTLPGGPEGPILGARGSVYKVNPWTGRSQLVATGFSGATNLALGWKGEIYVAEYFGGKISVVKNGKKADYVALPLVAAVETGIDGSLWAATTIPLDPSAPPTPGTIVKLRGGLLDRLFR